MRIAKATQAGRWGKVQALQRLLSRSHGGKMLAAKRVTENRSKSTPGVDGKVWSTPTAKWKGMLSLRHHEMQGPYTLRGLRELNLHAAVPLTPLRVIGTVRIKIRCYRALHSIAERRQVS